MCDMELNKLHPKLNFTLETDINHSINTSLLQNQTHIQYTRLYRNHGHHHIQNKHAAFHSWSQTQNILEPNSS